MKTMYNLKKSIKVVASIVLLVVISSCKKNKIDDTPKTVEEFKVIMATDQNFQNFLQSSQTAVLERAKLSYTPVKDKESAKNELSNAKSREDIIASLEKHNIKNAEKFLQAIEDQANALLAFLQDYPNFRLLSDVDKKTLLVGFLKENQKKEQNKMRNILKSGLGKVSLVDGSGGSPGNACANTYNETVYGCDTAYGMEMASIWASFIYATSATGGMGTVPAALIASIATAAAVYIYDTCWENAGIAMNRCMNTL